MAKAIEAESPLAHPEGMEPGWDTSNGVLSDGRSSVPLDAP